MRKFPALIALAAAIAPIPAQAADGLYYWTFGGGPAKRSWEVFFGVTGAKKGWIVQKVDTLVTMNGTRYKINTFWEAFKVENGKSTDYDTFSRANPNVTYMKTHAEARYYSNLELPGCFKKLGKDGNAGDALVCKVDPKLPLDGNPVIRDFEVSYD